MYRLSVEDHPDAEVVALLGQGLTEHALPHTQRPGFQPIAALLRDANGKLVGGIWGYVNWNWLSVGLVWLPAELRGHGYGKELLLALEDAARTRGCQYAHLDTFSYQARPFYEKLGYEVFATLEDYPPGQCRYFMKKSLC